jgi:proteasomal ATPase-associated factor 1
MSQPMILPVANIQHDFLDVIADVNEGRVASEDIWISCYLKNGEPSSVHSKARVSLDEVDRSLVRLETLGGVGLRRENRASRLTRASLVMYP